MTVYEFNDLDEMASRKQFGGVHIADREDEEHRILLYQIKSFYVEVYFHKVFQVIRKYKAFASTELLQPYINQIDLVKRLNVD